VRYLSRLKWIHRITLILFVTVVANWLTASFTGYSLLGSDLFTIFLIAFLILLVCSLVPPLARRMLWRVRNRLFVTYFLIGAVPVLLILMLIALLFFGLTGAFTAYLAQTELNRRLEEMQQSAKQLAEDIQAGRKQPASDFPMQWIARTRNRSIVSHGAIRTIPSWSRPGFTGVVRTGNDTYFLTAYSESGAGDVRVEVFVYTPFDDKVVSDLVPGLGRVFLLRSSDFETSDSPPALVLDSERGHEVQFTAVGGFPLAVHDLETGATVDQHGVSVNAYSYNVVDRVLNTLGTWRSAAIASVLLLVSLFVVVELVAIASSVKLTHTLTRTVHDLYQGTKKVEAGDFAHRIPVRSRDQLSELATSFNAMTQRVEQLIEEVKGKEKLEAELEIARHVQSQLFPKEVPKLRTLELSGVCNPARVVSGDYYDFIPLDSRSTALVIGDISGKGISAALLMATLQSALHAQLTMTMNGNALSAAGLVARLNRQLYESTPPEKYATLYCGLYDDQSGLLSYTNAGHLAPIVLRRGEIIRLESNGTVVGMFPEFPYEQSVIQLQPGDLVTAFTDGITECENAGGEQFGERRLTELLLRHRDRPLEEIIRTITDTVNDWAANIDDQDDTTLLLARRH